ncbi:MAG TPA: LamG domain-containing protein, partial [Myxococcota bacterium]|nr:LamG domain-containing protein [Myxococcota bacterium]
CVVFGGNGYANMATSAALLAATGSLTVEMWVRIDTLPAFGFHGSLFARGVISSASHGGLLFIESNKKLLYCGAFRSSGSTSYLARKLYSTADLAPGVWTHVALVRDAANLTLQWYINGVRDSSLVLTGTQAPALHHAGKDYAGRLGASGAGADLLQGAIAEVRIWNAVRTAEELTANARTRITGTEPNLIAYWPLSENAGSTFGDRITGAVGSLTNTTWDSVRDDAGLKEPAP